MKWNLRDDHINPLIVPCIVLSVVLLLTYLIEDEGMEIQTSTAAIAFYGFICNPIWALIKVQFSVSQSTEIYNDKIYESKSNACIQPQWKIQIPSLDS